MTLAISRSGRRYFKVPLGMLGESRRLHVLALSALNPPTKYRSCGEVTTKLIARLACPHVEQNYMLVTADTGFVRRRRIARLICHEVCHQWYGDIVTPQSFDELWLKEVRLTPGTARRVTFICGVC